MFIVVICGEPSDCGAIKLPNFLALGTFCALSEEKFTLEQATKAQKWSRCIEILFL
jgi:hypothetical protein